MSLKASVQLAGVADPTGMTAGIERGPGDGPAPVLRPAATVQPGDLIEVTRLARGVDEPDVRVGERYVVEYVGAVESGGLYVTLHHPPVALVERLGDEWAIVGEGQL